MIKYSIFIANFDLFLYPPLNSFPFEAILDVHHLKHILLLHTTTY